jgi:hypothetical protein
MDIKHQKTRSTTPPKGAMQEEDQIPETVMVATGLGSVYDSISGIYYHKPAEYVIRCPTEDVPKKFRFQRAGVIPFVVEDDEIYYCMGVDAKYGELTDFGGCIGDRESALDAALRELEEESLGVFNFRDSCTKEIIQKTSVAIYNDIGVVVYFVPICANRQIITAEYNEQMKKHMDPENSGLVWVPHSVFCFLYKHNTTITIGDTTFPRIYNRICDVFRYIDVLTGTPVK